MGIMDLVEAVAPGCEMEFTGIRPGEKLHESLVSSDEARHAVVLEEMFVILPEHHPWGKIEWGQGKALPDGFAFTSDSNDRWLTVDELRDMVEGL
jgi:UDP-N-acetylglucosamine 4,6-dehydratase